MPTLISGRATYLPSSWRGTITLSRRLERLCLIIDRDVLRTDPEEAARRTVSAGVRFIQYRDKSGTRRSIYYTALRLARLVHEAGGIFIVNDHADIALAVDADGVHLGQEDLPIEHARKLMGRDRIIGLSTHSLKQAVEAEALGADYIGFGPIFHTSTKDAGPEQGTARLSEIKRSVSVPVVAIGGIGHENVRDVIRAGADCVAVISAILSADDQKEAAARMLQAVMSGLDNAA